MVDRTRIMSFGVILIAASSLFTLSAADECKMHDDVCYYTLKITYELTMFKGRQQVRAENGKLYAVPNDDPHLPPDNNSNTNKTNEEVSVDGVITMDGYSVPHKVIAVNGQIPGPPIEAYIGQTLIITVENHLYANTVTVHWHGLHQKGSVFMDGVPYVTQCPIAPGQSFQYEFELTQTGTFWYHSHSGAQRTMGLSGAFIIRERKPLPMPEYNMLVTEHNHETDSEAIFLKLKHGMFQYFDYHSCLVNGRGRYYSAPNVHNGAPLTTFEVEEGRQYRFRVIAAGSLYPFEVSVDGHEMQVVASDGYELEPYSVDIFTIFPGERYDFVITANADKSKNYWIRGIYPHPQIKDKFEAILHYKGGPDGEPTTKAKECTTAVPCTVLNCGSMPMPPSRKCIHFTEMNAVESESPRLTNGQWKEHFLNFGFPGDHGHGPGSVNGRRFKEPSVNSLYQPNEVDTLCDNKDCGVDKLCTCTHSLSLERDDVIQLVFTNMGVGIGFDHPIHMHGHSFGVVKMGYPTFNPKTNKLEDNSDVNCGGDPKMNYCNEPTWTNHITGGDDIPGIKLDKVPMKDTVMLPSGGYVVVRIKADNPGLWFMHCHTELHNMDGMSIMLNESFADVPKAPEHFPVCRSYTPDSILNVWTDTC